jgi:hypothetical protein
MFSLTQLAAAPDRNFFNTRLGRMCMGTILERIEERRMF